MGSGKTKSWQPHQLRCSCDSYIKTLKFPSKLLPASAGASALTQEHAQCLERLGSPSGHSHALLHQQI